MQITEVRIKLIADQSERLKAFCSITLDDCFVIRDLKIIDGMNGPFVAMPSRKLASHCPVCRYKNHIRAAFCNQCGTHLREQAPIRSEDGRVKLYADIAHPINSACREMIQAEVIAAFEEEKIQAQTPGYVSRYEDYDMDFEMSEMEADIDATGNAEPLAEVKSEPARNVCERKFGESPSGSLYGTEPTEKPRGPHLGFGHDRISESTGGFGTGIFDD